MNEETFTKEYFEIEKLKLELERLKKPWWKRNEYLSFVVPSVIAFGSLLTLYINGAFDFRARELQAKKTLLELDIRNYEISRDSLVQLRATLLNNIQNSLLQIDSLNEEITHKNKEMYRVYKTTDSLQKVIVQDMKKMGIQ